VLAFLAKTNEEHSDCNKKWEDLLKQLLIAAALVVLSGQVLAQKPSQGGSPSGGEPMASTSVNLNVGPGKSPWCFWGSAVYSPGARLNHYDSNQKTDACFLCNSDGTWSPCQ
jgi:hypothetical protein